jgi:IS5 family transposase
VTHPTDSKLLHRGIEILARRARRQAAKLIYTGRPHQAERQVRQLRTWLGRLLRDIGSKIVGHPGQGRLCPAARAYRTIAAAAT